MIKIDGTPGQEDLYWSAFNIT